MSDHAKDRIQLAEMFGWTDCFVGSDDNCWGVEPANKYGDSRKCKKLPNPFTDANDCEALINHLQTEFLIAVTVKFGKGVRFDHYSGPRREIEIGDWKQGVCELALKVNEQWIKTF